MLVLCSAIFNARAPAQEVAQAPSTEDQAGVIGCLRTINTAELTYANTYKNGFSSNLKALAAPDRRNKLHSLGSWAYRRLATRRQTEWLCLHVQSSTAG
ncbi:MAG: hypothetical protein DMG96_39795 [Acidobacteria bacterium]|nr:MAG: hypothetical protein DMG98_14615 [Acidobacteriota bacterium]PYV67266.1 MAG: hypothetical protein DMG96_39795 [Acidobacteriota bacterium]